MCNLNLKSFRTLSGPDRRAAMRAYLAKSAAVDFAAADPHALTVSQNAALTEMAKVVSWRKSPASPLSVGLAFYVYLSRDVAAQGKKSPVSPGVVLQVRGARPVFAFGRGAA